MLNVLHPRNSRELQATERCYFLDLDIIKSASKVVKRTEICLGATTHALLNNFNIIIANPDPPRPSEVPASLSREVLDHDPAQDDELGFDAV